MRLLGGRGAGGASGLAGADRRLARRLGGELARASLQRSEQGDEPFRTALGAAARHPAEACERLTFHGAWGHAYWHSSGLGDAPAWLRQEGALRREALVERHVRTLSDLAEAGRLLDAAQVAWLTFKGPVLSQLCYPRPDLRGYADLDLLVDPDHLGVAVAALTDAGWPVVDNLHDLVRRPLAGEMHLVGPAGTPVDLHWHFFYRAEQRARTTVEPRRVLAARQTVWLGANTVPTLPTAGHLVYVCAHAAAAGAHRLRWTADVMRLSLTPDLDWDEVVRVARRWTLARSTALVLQRSRTLLGAPVPQETLRALDPSRSWAAVQRLAAAVDPALAGADRMSLTASIARQGDDDLRVSWSRLLAAAAHRRGRHDPSHDTVPRSSASVLDLPGGPEHLRSYVRDVGDWRLVGRTTA